MTTRLYAGQPVIRFEDHRLLRGKGAYIADLDCPGALHAAIVRSPYPHALILAVDVAAAMAAPGVVTVLTARDLPKTVKPIPGGLGLGSRSSRVASTPCSPRSGRCTGQPVAIVVAETLAQAADAAVVVDVSADSDRPNEKRT